MKEQHTVILPGETKCGYGMHLNSEKSVAVSDDYFWNEDMSQCPTGVKVQLLGSGGVAIYGHYRRDDLFWIGWAPLPKRRPSVSADTTQSRVAQ